LPQNQTTLDTLFKAFGVSANLLAPANLDKSTNHRTWSTQTEIAKEMVGLLPVYENKVATVLDEFDADAIASRQFGFSFNSNMDTANKFRRKTLQLKHTKLAVRRSCCLGPSLPP
jgi:hypothetical protein